MPELVQIGFQPSKSAIAGAPKPRASVLWIQGVTLAWMLVEFGVSAYAAVTAHSSAMLAFGSDSLGKAIPYGVFDLSQNEGWVSVGIDHDTARFAAQAIHRWWKKMGAKRYRNAQELLITADGGGSNGSRSRLWKVALQDLAVRLGIPVRVCHFPPGTSKWNKIEHRMFCHITPELAGTTPGQS